MVTGGAAAATAAFCSAGWDAGGLVSAGGGAVACASTVAIKSSASRSCSSVSSKLVPHRQQSAIISQSRIVIGAPHAGHAQASTSPLSQKVPSRDRWAALEGDLPREVFFAWEDFAVPDVPAASAGRDSSRALESAVGDDIRSVSGLFKAHFSTSAGTREPRCMVESGLNSPATG